MASNVPLHLPQWSDETAVPANTNGVCDQLIADAGPSEKKPPQSDKKSPKLIIKIRIKNSNKTTDDPATNSHANATTNHGSDKGSDQSSTVSKASTLNVLMIESKPTQTMTTNNQVLVRDQSRKVVGGHARKKEKKPPFSVTLSRKEIEEDLFGISNLRNKKLKRNPKKRSRDVQRQLDRLFPGLM